MSRSALLYASSILVVLGSTACGGMIAGALKDGTPAMEREPDLALAEDAMAGNLKLVEAMLVTYPDTEGLRLLAAQGLCSYANGFLEDRYEAYKDADEWEDPRAAEWLEDGGAALLRADPLDGLAPADRAGVYLQRAKALYLRCAAHAFHVLDDDEDFAKARKSGSLDALKKALEDLDEDDAGALFWAAFGLGGSIGLSLDDPEAMSQLSVVKTMMQRMLELDPGFFHGSPHLFFAVMNAKTPKMFGGDPVKAEEHFAAVQKLNGDKHLLAKVMRARFLLRRDETMGEYEKELRAVVDADPNLWPEQRLLVELARRKARRYLLDVPPPEEGAGAEAEPEPEPEPTPQPAPGAAEPGG